MNNLKLDDVRSLLVDFSNRLVRSNGADPEKVKTAVAKVGRLMAAQVIKYDILGMPGRCTKCPICNEEPEALQHSGSGNPSARVLLVGQGAGETEGQFGLPFVGIAGTLLTMALEDAGLPRETVWLTNTIKCRPKDNRAPSPDETEECISLYLEREINVIKPRVIVALGMSALQSLVSAHQLPTNKISQLRGQQFEAEIAGAEYPVIATYHPAYVVRKHGDDFKQCYETIVADLKTAASIANANLQGGR